jgi:hypothetical protein
MNSFSHALFVAGPPENDFLGPAKKPAKSRRGAESQLEKAPSIEMFRAKPVAVEPLQQKYHVSTAFLLGDGSTWNGVQTTSTEPANAPPDTQQTPPVEVFQSDTLLNAVEMELIWLGEESMYCLVCPEFQFDFIYEYASPVLKAGTAQALPDDQSEAVKLKQIVLIWTIGEYLDTLTLYKKLHPEHALTL